MDSGARMNDADCCCGVTPGDDCSFCGDCTPAQVQVDLPAFNIKQPHGSSTIVFSHSGGTYVLGQDGSHITGFADPGGPYCWWWGEEFTLGDYSGTLPSCTSSSASCVFAPFLRVSSTKWLAGYRVFGSGCNAGFVTMQLEPTRTTDCCAMDESYFEATSTDNGYCWAGDQARLTVDDCTYTALAI